ncbi:MAG TPA: diaminopimelate epimerase [Candidatus Marinimicrobia bacterium]|jgi:diaminopimelate epimerase|nr:diaminopimelate epimerase [Candidatus Neomarinimicrobiota bacterium]HQM36212.1 diaminopimelate epimerase [Candidatus Neomarinimicrobiota bacterium]
MIDPKRIHFYKMSGAGNDFILIDNRQGLIDADNCQDLIRQICQRKLSVGADGVILIENDPEVDFRWRFFNADASEAEMCGNGARCAVRFAYLAGIVNKPNMAFRTMAGIIRGEILSNRVKVQMVTPHKMQMDLKLNIDNRNFGLDFINTGVPHVVWLAENERELESIDVLHLGMAIRFHPAFQPAGTNVNFIYIENSHHLVIRTYERGVEGETLACGTGSVAACLTSAIHNRVISPVEVKTRGGEKLTVYFEMYGSKQNPNANQFREVCLEGEVIVAYEADLWTETLQ